MSRWLINGRFAGQSITGVQRYAGQIVTAIDRLIGDGKAHGLTFELLAPQGTQIPFALSNIPVRIVGRHNGHVWEQTELPFIDRHSGILSLANTGPILKSRHVVCIHDTNTRNCPESYSLSFRTLYRGLHPVLGRTAGRIATVSHFSASEIARLGIAPSEKIFVAPNGHDHALAWMPEHTEATRAAASPSTVVVLGSAAPHKNIAMLLDLAPQLHQHGLRLAIAGMTDGNVFASDSAKTGKSDVNIHWLGRIADDALAALLRDSLCLAFPSLTEGFGLPPLEAMARGCPVVVTDRASLPEICREAALYAPPDKPDRWLAQILRLRADAELRRQCVERGISQVQNYRWESSAATYIDVIRSLNTSPTQGAEH